MCVSGRESSCSAPSADVDRAFDDCSSRWPVKATPRNLPRARQPVYRGEPGYRRLLRGASPEPDSTPRRETLRSPWRDRRVADRRHPRQRLLRREIPARPCVRDERLPQIGSALAAEVAAVADLRPELLGRVSSAARLAERHWMVRAQLKEQRPESDKQHHNARIMSSSTSLSSTGSEIVR